MPYSPTLKKGKPARRSDIPQCNFTRVCERLVSQAPIVNSTVRTTPCRAARCWRYRNQ